MSDAAYERQHLALFAAGYINGAGTTAIGLGCAMTRIALGHYGLILDASNGLVDDESFTFVQCKGTAARTPVVQDLSNVNKIVRVFNTLPTEQDTDIEVAVYRSVSK